MLAVVHYGVIGRKEEQITPDTFGKRTREVNLHWVPYPLFSYVWALIANNLDPAKSMAQEKGPLT